MLGCPFIIIIIIVIIIIVYCILFLGHPVPLLYYIVKGLYAVYFSVLHCYRAVEIYFTVLLYCWRAVCGG